MLVKVITKVGFIVRFDLEERQVFCFFFAFRINTTATLGMESLVHYRKVASSNTSCLEAHAGFFRLLMKGIFGPYVL